MNKATWEEIKALASDFKRTQAILSNQKLTDRNCIDILNHLSNTKQISLYFTTDGKTFLTSQELEKEIYEELEVANGRIELTKLSSVLDIDLDTIETVVNKILSIDSNLHLVMSTIVNSSYIRSVALKINDIIKEKNGKITILELTQIFSLPKSFIDRILSANIGTIIAAHRDPDSIYTNEYIRRYSSIIRGYLSRSSKPVSISHLSHRFSLSDRLTVTIITGLIDRHRINGRIDNHQFVPNIHTVLQRIYIERFFQQNNFIDFDTVRSIGITNPVRFITDSFDSSSNLTILSNCAIGDAILSQIDAAIIDLGESFIDVVSLIPTVAATIVSSDDLSRIIRERITADNQTDLVIIADRFIVSRAMIDRAVDCFQSIIRTKAERFAKDNWKSILTDSMKINRMIDESIEKENENQSKRVSKFKSGGGLRGREIKVKSVKHKYNNSQQKQSTAVDSKSRSGDCSGSTIHSFELVSESEAIEMLGKFFELDGNIDEDDSIDYLLTEIFRSIEKQLNYNFKIQCRQSVLQSTDGARDKTEHQKLDSTVSTMINKIRLFEKGIAEIIIDHNDNTDKKTNKNKIIDTTNESSQSIVSDSGTPRVGIEIDAESLRVELARYNLKTVCTDLTNRLFERIAADLGVSWQLPQSPGINTDQSSSSSVTSEMRSKLIGSVPSDWALLMRAINKSLRDETGSFEPFHRALESICARLDLFYQKKVDNRKTEKSLVQEIAAQYQSIIESKAATIEPGELLLLTAMLLFQKSTGMPLHASGKFVPSILEFLRRKSAVAVDWDALKQYQEYVVALATARSRDRPPEEIDVLKQSNEALHQKIIDIGLNWKKLK